MFALPDASLDELAQQSQLVRLATLILMTAGARRAAGLRHEATGRNPRHFDVTFEDLDDGVARLAGNRAARAVVRVVSVDDGGLVRFASLPSSVAKNRHLLDRAVA